MTRAPILQTVPRDEPGEADRRAMGKPVLDSLSGPGAHQLAEMIRAYWRERGHLLEVRVQPFAGPTRGWGVRSNIGPAGLR